MKRFLSISILCLLSSNLFAQADKIIGIWLTEDKGAHVEIYKKGNIYFGKIVWLKEAINKKTGEAWLDEQNEDKSKRNIALLGSKMLWNFTFNDNEYVGGKVYDSRNGKTYKGKLWLENDAILKMRAYVGIFFSTESWTKVK
ncbi:MAG: DUF2147 domain-containing protein [Chitinophagales bacterium]